MIDWDFETRLVDRIAARKLLATRLTERQRSVLCGRYRHDQTLQQVAQHVGVTRERIRQIEIGAFKRLRNMPLPPRPTTRSEPPPHFDRAAFLRHMQLLIRLRETEAQEAIRLQEIRLREVYKRERQELDDLLEREAPKPPPKPQPKPSYTPPPLQPPPLQPPRVNVEPWFDRSQLPTLQHLQRIALYAVNYLVSARGRPLRYGIPEPGPSAAQVVCARDADAIAAAMMRLVQETIPATAQLSTHRLDVPDGWLGVSIATSCAAVRVVSLFDGMSVALDVTWDENA